MKKQILTNSCFEVEQCFREKCKEINWKLSKSWSKTLILKIFSLNKDESKIASIENLNYEKVLKL